MTEPLIEKALKFAIRAHGDQKYGEYPYAYHLQSVANQLGDWGYTSEEYQCSAILHDTIEDTGTTKEELAKEFTPEIAEIVYAVSDEPGKNRAERHEKTYPKIASNQKALVVKLADRVSNVKASLNDAGKFKMYKKEYDGFKKALYSETNKKMWDELDRLMGV
jgi:(p)ppGpp synthase/HD superfamily hydrolase